MSTPRPSPAPSPRSDLAVEVTGLTKRFGDRTVIDNVALQVPRGSTFGYLGPNGAGKTTLIRVLLGLTPATTGTMSLLGIPVPSRRTEALARVGAIVDEPRFHGYLTGRREPLDPGRGSRPGRSRSHPRLVGACAPDRAGRRQGLGVFHGHAATPWGGRLSPWRPRSHDPRRADERPGPRRHARVPLHDQELRRRGPYRRAVVPPPRRSGEDVRCRRHRGQRPRSVTGLHELGDLRVPRFSASTAAIRKGRQPSPGPSPWSATWTAQPMASWSTCGGAPMAG